MGPMHNDNVPLRMPDCEHKSVRSTKEVENVENLRKMCAANQWDTFFNQLYAIKVVENIDRSIVGNCERADAAKQLAEIIVQALDGTPFRELHEEKCLATVRHYINIGTEPFASRFLRTVEKRLVARTEAAEQGWALMAILAQGTHTRLGQDSALLVFRDNIDVLHLIAQHVTETA